MTSAKHGGGLIGYQAYTVRQFNYVKRCTHSVLIYFDIDDCARVEINSTLSNVNVKSLCPHKYL